MLLILHAHCSAISRSLCFCIDRSVSSPPHVRMRSTQLTQHIRSVDQILFLQHFRFYVNWQKSSMAFLCSIYILYIIWPQTGQFWSNSFITFGLDDDSPRAPRGIPAHDVKCLPGTFECAECSARFTFTVAPAVSKIQRAQARAKTDRYFTLPIAVKPACCANHALIFEPLGGLPWSFNTSKPTHRAFVCLLASLWTLRQTQMAAPFWHVRFQNLFFFLFSLFLP